MAKSFTFRRMQPGDVVCQVAGKPPYQCFRVTPQRRLRRKKGKVVTVLSVGPDAKVTPVLMRTFRRLNRLQLAKGSAK